METLDKIGAEPSERDDLRVEAMLNEVTNLEEYGKLGKRLPLAKAYRFKAGADSSVVHDPTSTGLEMRELAGLLPAKEYMLRVKFADERPCKVELEKKVNLHRPGVEQFKALPRDQTEVRDMTPRCDFDLLAYDG